MNKFDHSTLVAYVDGELDAVTAREVETQLAHDPDARAFVQRTRETAALLRVAFNEVLHEPVPARILATLPEPKGVEPSRTTGPGRRALTFAGWRQALPLAASVAALAIGLGVGYRLAEGPAGQGLPFAQTSYYHDLAAADKNLSDTLENVVSGTPVSWKSPDGDLAVKVTPVRTYRNSSDQYCREFQRELSHGRRTEVQHGLSCREGDGVWKTKYLILDAPETPTQKVGQKIPG